MLGQGQATHRIVGVGWGISLILIPAKAKLAEHLIVDSGSDQMAPGSIPGGRTFLALRLYAAREVKVCHHIPETWWNQIHVHRASQVQNFEAPMTAVSDLSGLKKQQRGKR